MGDDVDHDTPLPWIPAPRLRTSVQSGGMSEGLRRAYVRGEVEHTFAKSRTSANEPAMAAYTLLHASMGGEAMLMGRAVRIDIAAHNLTDQAYRDFLNRYRDFALNPGRDIALRLSTEL